MRWLFIIVLATAFRFSHSSTWLHARRGYRRPTSQRSSSSLSEGVTCAKKVVELCDARHTMCDVRHKAVLRDARHAPCDVRHRHSVGDLCALGWALAFGPFSLLFAPPFLPFSLVLQNGLPETNRKKIPRNIS